MDLWEKIPKAALKPGIDTKEKFEKALDIAWGWGVSHSDAQAKAFEPVQLKALHGIVFAEILRDGWSTFRDEVVVPFAANSDKPKNPTAVNTLLKVAADKCGSFLNTASDDPKQRQKEQIARIALYHSALMQIRPFRDNEESPVINRILAGIVLESQLRHCFGSEKLSLKVDATEYEYALRAAHRDGAFGPLEQVIRTLAGPALKLEPPKPSF